MIYHNLGLAMVLALSLGIGSIQAAEFKSYISQGQCGDPAIIDDLDVMTHPLEYASVQFDAADVKLEMPFRVRYTLTRQLVDQFYVTYILKGGATWGTDLRTENFELQNADGSRALGSRVPLVAIVQGGKNTDSTVSFIVQCSVDSPANVNQILDFQFKVGKAQEALGKYGQLGIEIDLRIAAAAETNPLSGGIVADSKKTLLLAVPGSGVSIDLSAPTPNSGAYISVKEDGKVFEGPVITDNTFVDYGTIKIANAGTGLSSTTPLPNGGDNGVMADLECKLKPIYWNVCDPGNLASVSLSIEDGNFSASTKEMIYIESEDPAKPIPATEKLADNITANWTITDSEQLAALCKTTRKIMLNVDGVTEINENRRAKPTGTLKVEFKSGKIISETIRLRHLKKDGSVCTLYNIPNSTALDRLNIRVTNDSTIKGFVKGSLRGQDGIDIFRGALLVPVDGLAPNQTIHFSSADIIAAATAAGKEEWTGRAVLTLESNIPEGQMEVYGLLRAATQPFPAFSDSPLMNMSTGATGNGCS